ncbi:hypothetical protein [Streptomyces griseorubiginosus]|uniref:hypothetical protein n=1 Tax=Streptomyces griseorubiginosus TaxID=67304 RepID=UPI0036E427E7
MSQLIPLRALLDDSGLPHKPAALPQHRMSEPTNPREGAAMSLGRTITVPADEVREVFTRLQPHLPPYLRKIEPTPYNGLRFELAPFTGREERPAMPRAFYDDPTLRFVAEEDNPREFRIREMAERVLSDLLEQAGNEWRDAAYVADLKDTVRDAPDRWRAYEREAKALESAYTYLRTPEAAKEWPAALSRLVDAQDRTRTAAAAFDERAEAIARVHEKHLYADLAHVAALTQAGHPDAAHWPIVSADDYGSSYFSSFSTHVPLTEQVRRLIEQQDNHITKVGHLMGTAAV